MFRLGLQAVNFDGVFFDVDDLSTVRGASAAALESVEGVEAALKNVLPQARVRSLSVGGSRGEWLIEHASEQAIREALNAYLNGQTASQEVAEVLPYLSFATAVVPEAEADRLESALGRSRFHIFDLDIPDYLDADEVLEKLQQDSQDDPGTAFNAMFGSPPLGRPCSIDRQRPIARLSWITEDGKAKRTQLVSDSVFQRKTFGRTGRRPQFYRTLCGLDVEAFEGESFSLADSFEEIAREGAGDAPDVPEALHGKFMIVYMDGNNVSHIRERLVRPRAEGADGRATDFARSMKGHRSALLRGILRYVMAKENAPLLRLAKPSKQFFGPGDKRVLPVLRFETLMWGGDESLMVLPAWAYDGFVTYLATLLQDEEVCRVTVDGASELLTYSIGIVLANHKTPIRAASELAQKLLANAKREVKKLNPDRAEGRDVNMIDTMVLGGIDLPTKSLGEERKQLFGIAENEQGGLFALPLPDMAVLLSKLTQIKGVPGDADIGIPRSKISDLVENARDRKMLGRNGLRDPLFEARDDVERLPLQERVGTLLGQYRYAAPLAGASGEVCLTPYGADFLSGDNFAWCRRAPAMPFLHLLLLWNYLGIGAATAHD